MRLAVLSILISMPILLAAGTAAHAEPADRWTCQVIGDIGRERAQHVRRDVGDLLIYSNAFSRAHPAQQDKTFDEYWDANIANWRRHSNNGAPDPAEFRSLIQSAWTNWQAGGPVQCPSLDVNWASASEAHSRIRPLLQQRLVRASLPPDHPDHLPPVQRGPHGWHGEDVPRLTLIQISPPAFDDYGQRAVTILGAHGHSVVVYRWTGDAWVQEEFYGLLLM